MQHAPVAFLPNKSSNTMDNSPKLIIPAAVQKVEINSNVLYFQCEPREDPLEIIINPMQSGPVVSDSIYHMLLMLNIIRLADPQSPHRKYLWRRVQDSWW